MPKNVLQDTLEDVGEGLKSQVEHTTRAIVKEPVNIFQDLIGEAGSNEQSGSGTGSGQKPVDPKLQQLKLQDDMKRQQQLANIRRHIGNMQKIAIERKQIEAEKQQKDEKDEVEEDQKEQGEIVQLKVEKEKEDVLQRTVKEHGGTKESGPRKQF